MSVIIYPLVFIQHLHPASSNSSTYKSNWPSANSILEQDPGSYNTGAESSSWHPSRRTTA